MARVVISPKVNSTINDKLQEQGIELLEIEYRREQNGRVLRLYIDTASGVDSDTCAAATRAVKDYIDTLNDLDYDYLEVSSPGIDRILKKDSDFARFQGSRVMVKTLQPVLGRKKLIGNLADVTKDLLNLEIDGQSMQINRDLISIIRLHPDI